MHGRCTDGPQNTSYLAKAKCYRNNDMIHGHNGKVKLMLPVEEPFSSSHGGFWEQNGAEMANRCIKCWGNEGEVMRVAGWRIRQLEDEPETDGCLPIRLSGISDHLLPSVAQLIKEEIVASKEEPSKE
ncbi:hypothetical protein Taro_008596 [Colocasia esculenta]|uniref:Uncharacterized protein n=1 Tax=Colocasia esculenta TaxID=4460 RepID=A0A843U7F4_COLES|nr:hypothetical protein [Colocasia esculenta]